MTISKSELIKRYSTVQNLETFVKLAATDTHPDAQKYHKELLAHLANWHKCGGYFIAPGKNGKELSFNDNDEVVDANDRVVKKELLDQYKVADATVACDTYKAAYYRHTANGKPEKTAPAATGFTQKLYNGLGNYTLVRIVALGLYLVVRSAIEWPTGPFSAVANQVLHGVIGFAGLTFGLELMLDSAMILKSVFSPTGEAEKRLPWYKRLANIYSKGSRPGRMVNAAVWFGINLGCFIVTGGFSLPLTVAATAVANLIGFGVDMLHVVYRTTIEIDRLENLQKIVNTRLAELNTKKNPTLDEGAEFRWLNERTNLLAQEIAETCKARARGVVGAASTIVAGVALLGATFIGLGLITAIGAGAIYPLLIVAGICYAAAGLIYGFKKWWPEKQVESTTPPRSPSSPTGPTGGSVFASHIALSRATPPGSPGPSNAPGPSDVPDSATVPLLASNSSGSFSSDGFFAEQGRDNQSVDLAFTQVPAVPMITLQA